MSFRLIKTYLTKNIQKIKNSDFFRKKVITKKKEFSSNSAPLFNFVYPISEKTHRFPFKNAVFQLFEDFVKTSKIHTCLFRF